MRTQVYSSPSGKFKPHIDTPRGSTQFGSLVVCLPLEHEGGQLQVRHKGKEVTYDWGNHHNQISWAAFYSDCEHEVLEVKSGCRLTLTYNLYAVRGGGMLTGIQPPVLDATQLPIYTSLKSIMQSREFMPEGEKAPELVVYQWRRSIQDYLHFIDRRLSRLLLQPRIRTH